MTNTQPTPPVPPEYAALAEDLYRVLAKYGATIVAIEGDIMIFAPHDGADEGGFMSYDPGKHGIPKFDYCVRQDRGDGWMRYCDPIPIPVAPDHTADTRPHDGAED